MTSRSPLPPDPSSRFAGAALSLASALLVIFMAFHPRAHAHGKDHFIEAFTEIATVNAIVHGTLVALFLIMFYGLLVFADHLGTNHPAVRLGVIFFAFGMVPLACAAILSGFVVPAYVAQFANHDSPNLEILQYAVRLIYTIVFTATRVAVVALSLAILFWAIELSASRHSLALVGFLSGGLPLVALAFGYLPMDVHGMLFFALAQSAWGLSVGIALWRGKI